MGLRDVESWRFLGSTRPRCRSLIAGCCRGIVI